MDPAERALLEAAVGDAIGAVADGADTAGVDAVLRELGWLEMLDAERDDAIAVVFAALGASGATASVLDDVVATGLGLPPDPDQAVLLPPFATAAPPGRHDGDRLTLSGLATGRVARVGQLLVVAGAGDGLVTISIPAAATEVVPVRGVDPRAGLHRVHGELDGRPTGALDPSAWDAAVALGRRAVAQQMAGAARTMLDLARTHALEREQFGRPIARFQAVRHRLAEALVAIESLDATLVVAADASASSSHAMTAALAKAIAGRTVRTVGAHCQQVLAGIGFTVEHPFHHFLKRTILLDGVLGSAAAITVELGHTVLASRAVPTLVEL